jgi:GT2 family glycosyltransferase
MRQGWIFGVYLLFGTPFFQIDTFWTAFFLNRVAPLNYVNEKWVWRREASETPVRVQKLLGAFLFVRREVFQQVGLFDEGYFLFSEEEDFGYRVSRQGWAIYYFPATKIIHLGGQSAATNKPGALLYANESMIRFFRKHYGKLTQLIFRAIWFLALVLQIGLVLLSLNSQRSEMIKAYLRAIAALFQPMTLQERQSN